MDLVPHKKHSLTPAQFEQLADVPPEEEWLANITNLKTRRAYKEDVREFILTVGLSSPKRKPYQQTDTRSDKYPYPYAYV
jgi:hypothetical protein